MSTTIEAVAPVVSSELATLPAPVAIDAEIVAPAPSKKTRTRKPASESAEAERERLASEALASEQATVEAGNAPAEAKSRNLSAEEFANVKAMTVERIVVAIGAKHSDESARSFNIGRDGWELAIQWRSFAPNYTSTHYEAMCNEIRTTSLIRFSIKPESIRISEWIKSFKLRESVRELVGDTLADSLNITECLHVAPKAFKFDTSSLDNGIHTSWFRFFQELDSARRKSHADTVGASFEKMVADYIKRLADESISGLTDEQRQKVEDSRKRAEAVAKTTKAANKIGEAVEAALKDDLVSPLGIIAILETKAGELGVEMPSSVGFNPAECTVEDCNMLAEAMFKCGKFREMQVLRDRLSKLISRAEAIKAKQDAERATACTRINPGVVAHATPAA